MKRYFAKEVNGKGYLFDKQFSVNVPIAVEANYETAAELAEKYNSDEE